TIWVNCGGLPYAFRYWYSLACSAYPTAVVPSYSRIATGIGARWPPWSEFRADAGRAGAPVTYRGQAEAREALRSPPPHLIDTNALPRASHSRQRSLGSKSRMPVYGGSGHPLRRSMSAA